MTDLTSKTTTELVADSGNGVQDWALRHANHAEAPPGHGGWGRVDPGDEPAPPVVVAPTLTSLAPATGPAATVVTLTGTGFVAGATVANGTAVTVNSATSITATIGTGAAAGALQVTVTNPDGGVSGAQTFTVA